MGVFPNTYPPTFFTIQERDIGLRKNNGSPRILRCLIPDPATWELGKRAWEMRASGASYAEIESELKLFPNQLHPGSTYYGIFRNEIYIGRFEWGGKVYEDYVPHLVTPEQWQAVKSRTFKRPRKGQTHPADKTHPKRGRTRLLSGLCWCGYCQARMHASKNTRSDRKTAWPYYICARKNASADSCESGKISAYRLEEEVVNAVMQNVLTIEFIGR